MRPAFFSWLLFGTLILGCNVRDSQPTHWKGETAFIPSIPVSPPVVNEEAKRPPTAEEYAAMPKITGPDLFLKLVSNTHTELHNKPIIISALLDKVEEDHLVMLLHPQHPIESGGFRCYFPPPISEAAKEKLIPGEAIAIQGTFLSTGVQSGKLTYSRLILLPE